MIQQYSNNYYDYNLQVDYSKIMKEEWIILLKDILTTQEMADILFSIKEVEKSCTILPSKKDIFKSFNVIKPQDINVCIIECNPIITERSTGIAFANKNSYNNDYDEHLINLLNKVNNYDQSTEHKIDYTLMNWVEQGVFLYNTALTQIKNVSTSQRTKWHRFSKKVIEKLSFERQGLIFLFIGSEQECAPFIQCVNKQKHTILQNHVLDYDSLNEINLEITGINGKDYRIEW